MKVKSLSCVWLSVTPWTAAYQAPPSMGFSSQEYQSKVPLPSLIRMYTMPENIDVITISDSNYFNYSDVCKVDQVTHKMIMVWREMESTWFPTLSQENELLADTTIFTNPANNHGRKDCGPDLNVRPIMMIISSTHLTELRNEFYLNFQSDFCVSATPLQCILRNLCLDMQVTNTLNQSVVWRK